MHGKKLRSRKNNLIDKTEYNEACLSIESDYTLYHILRMSLQRNPTPYTPSILIGWPFLLNLKVIELSHIVIR